MHFFFFLVGIMKIELIKLPNMIKFLKPKGKFAIAMYVTYEAAITTFSVDNWWRLQEFCLERPLKNLYKKINKKRT